VCLIFVGCQQEIVSPKPAPAAPKPSSVISPASRPPAVRYRMADCHLHLVDFLQRTDGIGAALAAMDQCGVEEARMLGKYPNLRVDVSWVVYETNLMKNGTPDPAWVRLIEAFPDRFLIGTDKVGHFADYPQEVQKYYRFLDALRPATANKLARENLLSILPKAPARLTLEESEVLNGRLPEGTDLLKKAS
jgi:hypothetical protein